MWIKICANTCAEDALKAAELGADAVGFVFAPSSRRVTAAQVRAISAAMPDGVERVGVFGEASADEISKAATRAKLTTVQMHGGFRRAVSERLRVLLPEIQVIETVHWRVGADAASEGSGVAAELREIASCDAGGRVLVDAQVGAASGGTGRSFDWESAKAALSGAGTKIVVAGGLRPENVVEAIRVLRPWGVDVASGVERKPGRKDYEKLRSFIENARRA